MGSRAILSVVVVLIFRVMEGLLLRWVGLQFLGLVVVFLFVRSDSLWRIRKYLAAIISIIICWLGLLSGLFGTGWVATVTIFIHFFMILSLFRVYNPYSSEKRLRAILTKDHLNLMVLSVIFLLGMVLYDDLFFGYTAGLGLVLVISLVSSIGTLISTIMNVLKTTRPNLIRQPNAKLPAISVAIAARNEVHAIKQSLEQIIASNYPKMEILVLDDCSQDGTSDIIKTFAHDGVRFIEGKVPSPSWQARNLAFDKLSEESSGDYIVFMGVDVHVGVRSIRDIIESMLKNNLDMVSVLPYRRKYDFLPNFLLLPRNFFQLALPRTIVSPPVLSSFWVIKKDVLEEMGGFDAVRSTIMPEEYFARGLSTVGKYKFLKGKDFDVSTRKRFGSQVETEIRNLYPQMQRSIFTACLSCLGLAIFYLLPFFSLPFLVFVDFGLAMLALASVLILTTSNLIISSLAIPKLWPFSILNFPIVILIEWLLILVSAYKYEFSEVLWKGRNACVPLQLEVIPRLPFLDEELPKAKV